LRFLANENIPIASILNLRSIGLDVFSIIEKTPGISDSDVMELAIKENRTIITYDSDYGELVFKLGYKPKAGIIYLRIQPEHPLHCAEMILNITKKLSINFRNKLTIMVFGKSATK